MIFKRSCSYKILVLMVISVFFINIIPVNASEPSHDNITPMHRVFTEQDVGDSPGDPLLDAFADLKQKFGLDKEFFEIFFFISKKILIEKQPIQNLPGEFEKLQEDLGEKARTILDKEIDLSSIVVQENVILIPFSIDGKNGIAKICLKEHARILKKSDDRWELAHKYGILVERDETDQVEKDLKGSDAPVTNPAVDGLIKQGQIVEVYLDEESDTLRANRVRLVEDYRPGITAPEEYFGESLDIGQIFTIEQKNNIEKWIKEHKIRGSPVKFRIALGMPALGLDNDIEHSNISHAGVRDRAIYIGSALLKHISKDNNRDLWQKIIDEDEFRHLRGLDHGTDEQLVARLDAVDDIIVINKYEDIRRAMLDKDVYFLRDELRGRLDDPEKLADMFSVINDIALSQPLYPVERTYPIKKAVSLLEKEEKDELGKLLTSDIFREQKSWIIVDDILLILVPSLVSRAKEKVAEWVQISRDWVRKNWIRVYSPELEGRTLWQISPEISNEAGGLARVMQYHGAGIQDLIGNADVKLRQIEPRYKYRIEADGKERSIDYTSDITNPIKDLEEVKDEMGQPMVFTVTMGDQPVDFTVSYGTNTLGIEVFLIENIYSGEGPDYTHSIYNYNAYDSRLPTWEQFSAFYSKASLEFVRYMEKKEREEKGAAWKAPVVHINDSQTALVAVYKKIELDKEVARRKENSDHEVDPVLEDATIAFTTHTYRNRWDYPVGITGGYGEYQLLSMDIPMEYFEFFKNRKTDWLERYDIASAGLRLSDWQGTVSRAHRDDVSGFDEWVNDSGLNWLQEIVKKFIFYVKVIAVSNGDDHEKTAEFFRRTMKDVCGNDVDVDYPTADQVAKTKQEAKKRLRLKPDQKFYSTYKPKEKEVIEEGEIINDEQIMISYSGRLVPEKAGRERAFTNENIKILLEKDAQIVIYGNKQENNPLSEQLARGYTELIDEIKEEQENGTREYTGRLVFVPKFSLDNDQIGDREIFNGQRVLLAATDIQVQDSDPGTEAAGYTESDVSACGGLQLPTYRKDNYSGEGLLEAQGLPINFEKPGEGNTLIPESASPESYRKVLLQAIEKYSKDINENTLKYYQATSVRLSRALNARATSAAYLREFSKAVADKAARKKLKRILEEREKMEKRKAKILSQIKSDPIEETDMYIVEKVFDLAGEGKVNAALTLFFTSAAFADLKNNLHVPVGIFNKLIEAYSRDKRTSADITDFAKAFLKNVIELGESEKYGPEEEKDRYLKDLQLMAGQMLTIISWMNRGVPGAEGIRLTDRPDQDKPVDQDPEGMAESVKGRSFIRKSSLPEGVERVEKEGDPGFYWRGTEGIKKLGDNVTDKLIYDKELKKKSEDRLVMYLMDHGFMDTGSLNQVKGVSTIHETYFINDTLPGSAQTTSTGAGHFQGETMDIKYVTEGEGVQVNVLYDETGENIKEVIIHKLKPGDWCLSLPGYVDYMINLGGLRFNDMSIYLRHYPDYFDAIKKKIGREMGVVKAKIKHAPYIGVMDNNGAKIIKAKAMESTPKTIKTGSSAGIMGSATLLSWYKEMTADQDISAKDVFDLGMKIAEIYREAIRNNEDFQGDKIDMGGVQKEQASLGVSEGLDVFTEDNIEFLKKTIGSEAEETKLIRVPVELLETIGSENVKGFFEDLQRDGHVYIELFSSQEPILSEDMYSRYGVDIRKPDDFTMNRTNTVTVFLTGKDTEWPESGMRNKDWKRALGEDIKDMRSTIVSPAGLNYDNTGLIRSVILGLRLSEIAKGDKPDDSLVSYTLAQYRDLCISMGQSAESFDLTKEDIINIARSDTLKLIVGSVNRLIKLLPIVPINTEELRMLYERVREIMIRA